jgi:hypothetical protein
LLQFRQRPLGIEIFCLRAATAQKHSFALRKS